MHEPTDTTRYPTRIDPRWAWALRVFGVRGPENAWTELDGDALDARFGWAHVRTPLANVTGWRIEGPWRSITALGVRMSIRHRDITFGGTARGGVRIDFRERVPLGPFRMPALYVTPEDPEGFAAELARRGIPGVDARRTKA